MKQANHYKMVIEALGMLGRRQAIYNKLNRVCAYTDDPKLKSLIHSVLQGFESSSTHTSHTPIIRMSACRITAPMLMAYCHKKLQ